MHTNLVASPGASMAWRQHRIVHREQFKQAWLTTMQRGACDK
jgi:hypothetical protein